VGVMVVNLERNEEGEFGKYLSQILLGSWY
jgi:hypothetical protein